MNEGAIGERVFYQMALELRQPGLRGYLLRLARYIQGR